MSARAQSLLCPSLRDATARDERAARIERKRLERERDARRDRAERYTDKGHSQTTFAIGAL